VYVYAHVQALGYVLGFVLPAAVPLSVSLRRAVSAICKSKRGQGRTADGSSFRCFVPTYLAQG